MNGQKPRVTITVTSVPQWPIKTPAHPYKLHQAVIATCRNVHVHSKGQKKKGIIQILQTSTYIGAPKQMACLISMLRVPLGQKSILRSKVYRMRVCGKKFISAQSRNPLARNVSRCEGMSTLNLLVTITRHWVVRPELQCTFLREHASRNILIAIVHFALATMARDSERQ